MYHCDMMKYRKSMFCHSLGQLSDINVDIPLYTDMLVLRIHVDIHVFTRLAYHK